MCSTLICFSLVCKNSNSCKKFKIKIKTKILKHTLMDDHIRAFTLELYVVFKKTVKKNLVLLNGCKGNLYKIIIISVGD
jgi:hypothetical protein